MSTEVQVEVLANEKYIAASTDFEMYIYDYETQIDMLSINAHWGQPPEATRIDYRKLEKQE